MQTVRHIVGAAICRPRATNSRPYIFFRKLFIKFTFSYWRGSALPPSDEGGGFAERRRRRERILPLSQPVRLTAPLTRGAIGAVRNFLIVRFLFIISRHYNLYKNKPGR